MAFKFEIIDNALVVTDTSDSSIPFDKPAGDTYYRTQELDKGIVSLYDTSGVNDASSVIFSKPLSECIDSSDTPFTDISFRDFVHRNLGNNKGGGAGVGAQSFSGWIDYNDTSAAVSLTADTWTDIPNNGAGAFSNRSPLPLAGGITDLVDTNTGYLDFSNFKIGDYVLIRHDFFVTPSTNNSTLQFRYFVGQTGQEYPLNLSIPRLDRGSGIPYQEVGLFYIYIGDENTRLGGARLQVNLSTSGSLNNNGMVIQYFIY